MITHNDNICQDIVAQNGGELNQEVLDFIYATPLPDGVQVQLASISLKDKKWDIHRYSSYITEQVLYSAVDFQKVADRVKECSGTLLFGMDDGNLYLKQAWFCHFRHCPVCVWRKSLLLKALAFQRMPDIVEAYPKHRFLFLTLTLKNCEIGDLKATLSHINKAWKRLTQRKDVANYVDGWIRTTEVTRNPKDNTAHPHLHIILMVKPSYFTHGYIKQNKWRELWQDALRIDYLPMVNIKPIKPKKITDDIPQESKTDIKQPLSMEMVAALCETLKYGIKIDDILGQTEEANEWFLEMCRQTFKSRFIASSGLLAGILKKDKNRNEEEITTQDMINIGESENLTDERRLAFSFVKDKRHYFYNPKFNQ